MPQTDERPLPDFVKNFPPEIAEAELEKDKTRREPERPRPTVAPDYPNAEPSRSEE